LLDVGFSIENLKVAPGVVYKDLKKKRDETN